MISVGIVSNTWDKKVKQRILFAILTLNEDINNICVVSKILYHSIYRRKLKIYISMYQMNSSHS